VIQYNAIQSQQYSYNNLNFIMLQVSAYLYKGYNQAVRHKRKNYTCVTPYLVLVLIALRYQIVYRKRYIYDIYIYDEPEITGCKISVYDSNHFKRLRMIIVIILIIMRIMNY
jgi:hypothetical protein